MAALLSVNKVTHLLGRTRWHQASYLQHKREGFLCCCCVVRALGLPWVSCNCRLRSAAAQVPCHEVNPPDRQINKVVNAGSTTPINGHHRWPPGCSGQSRVSASLRVISIGDSWWHWVEVRPLISWQHIMRAPRVVKLEEKIICKGWGVGGVIVPLPSPRKKGCKEFKGCRVAAARRAGRSRAARRPSQGSNAANDGGSTTGTEAEASASRTSYWKARY